MYKIKIYNNIDPQGLNLFDENYELNANGNADAILLRSHNLHDLEPSKDLKAIARAGAGTNNIPTERMSGEGVVVFNTPGANANAVKELVLASLLLSVRPIVRGANWVQKLTSDNISKDVEANKKQFSGSELEGKTLGVIGLGSIGAMVANDAYRLGMNVIGYDPYVSVTTAWSISRRVKRALSLEDIFRDADFISLHVPLNGDTKHLISDTQLAKMKNDVTLLNFARGELVDNKALLKALDNEQIGSYITDFADKSLLHHPQITVLPHLGASTSEAEVNCAKMAVRTLRHFLETGNIVNSVNFPDIELPFNSPTRFAMIHQNIPKMIGHISNVAGQLDINIDNMMNKNSGAYAYTLVDIPSTQPKELAALKKSLENIEGMIKVRLIRNL